jgi:hypothetical protein
MDLAVSYCPTRRNLEELAWALTGRLALNTDHLLALIGKDHAAFLSTRSDCHTIRDELSGLREQLASHRLMHHC